MSSGESKVQQARRLGLPVPLTEKQEAYARYSVTPGKTHEWAYFQAGYTGKKGSKAVGSRITKLNKDPRVAAIQNEVLGKRWHKVELSAERLEREYMAIAFSKVSDAVNWGTVDIPVGKDDKGQTITRSVFFVEPKKADEMDEDTLAAIKEISVGSNGGIKVAMHDKLTALGVLSRRYKRFVEKTAMERPSTGANASFTPEDVKTLKKVFDEHF